MVRLPCRSEFKSASVKQKTFTRVLFNSFGRKSPITCCTSICTPSCEMLTMEPLSSVPSSLLLVDLLRPGSDMSPTVSRTLSRSKSRK
ncbi:hypothetical protein M758_4G183400 [Ceratodon purpureus]|nr:hypothetical protein M758_4G183400 [Ceratodon purpureus]